VIVYPQVQGFCFHLQTLDVGDAKLVNFLLKLLNPHVLFALLVLLVMLLGHQSWEEGNRRPPLPFLAVSSVLSSLSSDPMSLEGRRRRSTLLRGQVAHYTVPY
jgi:hypothetical protein